ncbi:uncharacterized protein DNG_08061 [Cephalotrichum gorgonifer]|uniref:DUF1680 domain-containing protein n=1 Tax=Cephalotrichum gorgonifer TaxID=2041049 RepID=A0AAE8N4F6_9PEZI|nr:uncharacterized protein DNG_08061 [Cephalotrichum gorgonifer]
MPGHLLLRSGLALSATLLSLSNIPLVHAQPAQSFPLGDVQLLESRWLDNQQRTLTYLKFVDVDRLLYTFRTNHALDAQGAEPVGGWESPDFPFRSHSHGHFLSAWSQCWAVTGDQGCQDRALYMVGELEKCQANNAEAGFSPGYLAGFPESEIDKVENRTLNNGNVPYYAIHKTMNGLLDVWRHMDSDNARDVLLGMAEWVDGRTGRLSEGQLQEMLGTEYGGMNDILAQLARESKDDRWMAVAKRFDHAHVFDPLAQNVNNLQGLHANTQAQKFIGTIHEYRASGEQRYLDIAKNAYGFVVRDHTYAMGGNSQAEHWHEPGNISGYLKKDTCETCNTYNMLKVTRELWANEPVSHYFDFYERALLNHLLGVQHPKSEHGHITYFTSLNPGGRRGVGPAWGGGTWSTDYESFWCCQGTSLETNTKLMDSIYWYSEDGNTLYVNLFTPSTLKWADKNVTVTQKTDFPASGNIALEIAGSAQFDLSIRIPDWAGEDASLLINDEPVSDVSVAPGSYAVIQGRDWQDGDVVALSLPMSLRQIPAQDDENVVAFAYGPTVLAANYGDRELSGLPQIEVGSIEPVPNEPLAFTATAGEESVVLSAFYDAHDYNYNVYWRV